jgi:hypothetical protein
VSTISITPPLTFAEMKSFGDFRTVYCVPAEGGGAGALEPSTGMNYRPNWIQQHLQDIVDHFPAHEFAGYVEYRNTSEDQPPVARYYVRDRRVETATPTLVWPGERPSHYVLDLPMGENDAQAATIREYLIALLEALWDEQDGFDGKRPFGNSGWDCDLLVPLIRAGLIDGRLDEDGYIEEIDDNGGEHLIAEAIQALGGES